MRWPSFKSFTLLWLPSLLLLGFVAVSSHRRYQQAATERAAARTAVVYWETKVGDLQQTLVDLRARAEAASPLKSDAPGSDTDSNASAETMTGSVAGRVESLRKRLREHPEFAIPEIQLLSELDWVQVARFSDLSTDGGLRSAMGSLRALGEQRFLELLGPSLKAYTASHADWPTSLNELAGISETPLEPAMLSRYHLLVSGLVNPTVPGVFMALDIVEASEIVDPDFQGVTYKLNSTANVGSYPTWRRPMIRADQSARIAYVRAHDGNVPDNFEDYAPYIESDSLRRVMLAEQEASRALSPMPLTGVADFIDRLDRPEDRALAESIWPE